MQDATSTAAKRRIARKRREETPWIETVGGELRVWRDRDTNKIVIESPAITPKRKLIALTARHARHLASSLLLFAAETESSPAHTAAMPQIQVGLDAAKFEANGLRTTI
jgi:hypothetical protein